MRVTVNAWKCEVSGCGHVWLGEDGEKPPARCARCKSRQWNSSAIPRGPFGVRLRTREQVEQSLQRRAERRREATGERPLARLAR
jgi:hypothetical protein